MAYLNLTIDFAVRPTVEQGGQNTERCDEESDGQVVERQRSKQVAWLGGVVEYIYKTATSNKTHKSGKLLYNL